MIASEHLVTTMEQLQALYGEKMPASVVKEIDHINGSYRKLIEAAPFVAVATGGPEGLDCSPKGDAPGFVRVLDDKTLAIPDRPAGLDPAISLRRAKLCIPKRDCRVTPLRGGPAMTSY